MTLRKVLEEVYFDGEVAENLRPRKVITGDKMLDAMTRDLLKELQRQKEDTLKKAEEDIRRLF